MTARERHDPRRAVAVRAVVAVASVVLAAAGPSAAQYEYGPPTPGSAPAAAPAERSVPPGSAADLIGEPGAAWESLNPLSVLENAARLAPSAGGEGTGGEGEPSRGLSAALNVMLVLTVITLAPSIVLMATCFIRITVVLALLRQALGTQNLPPPQVTLGLALFMTALVMAPTLDRVWEEAVVPYQQGEVSDPADLWTRSARPFRDFMFAQIEATGNWSSLYMVLDYRGLDSSRPETLTRADVDMVSLVPAFMLSELKTAFLMGFRVYLPFLVIDMVISCLLISMSMMMLPPVLISLPFKLLLFVLVDGWTLVVGGLLASFVAGGDAAQAALWWPVVAGIAPAGTTTWPGGVPAAPAFVIAPAV